MLSTSVYPHAQEMAMPELITAVRLTGSFPMRTSHHTKFTASTRKPQATAARESIHTKPAWRWNRPVVGDATAYAKWQCTE